MTALPMVRVSQLPGGESERALVLSIAKRHRVDPFSLFGPLRYKDIVQARWELFASLRKRGWSLPKIGNFTNRTHATVWHGLRKLAQEPSL